MRELIAEAKRRHVFRTAGLYAGGAFGILQIADIVLPTLGLGDSVISYLLVIIAAGFPVALIFAWILDVSDDGIKVTADATEIEKSRYTAPKLIDGLIVVIALGVGYMYLERFSTGDPSVAVNSTADKSAPLPTAAPIVLEPSIAVLPFENLSASEENAYFAAGIHEDILNNLSKVGGLIVTSRTSTLAYLGSTKPIPVIAQDLGVNYIIEGSVRRVGQRVRISVQLIEAANDSHIWSEAYDRAIIDVFEIQQQVADEVSHALRVQFDIGLAAGETPTKSLKAYELFLESRVLATTMDPDNIQRAVTGYREALKIDPDYADAWAGLSIALSSTSMFGKADRAIEEANVAADKALELAPESWMSNHAKARLIGDFGLGSPVQSLPYFQKAVALNPNDGDMLSIYGFHLWFSGRTREAMAQFLAAYRRDPLSANANMSRAMVAMFENDRITAEKFIRRAIDIEPNSTYINWWAAAAFSTMLDYETALRQLDRVLTLNPDHLGALLWTSGLLTALGDYEAAEYWLDRVEAIAPNNPGYLSRRANSYALGGEPEQYQALVERWIKHDPDNPDAKRYLPFASSRGSTRARENEDWDTFRVIVRRSLNENLAFLKSDGDENGNFVVRPNSSWNFLAGAANAKTLKEDALADQLLQQLIDFYESQPVGASQARNLQMMMAYAMLDKHDEAMIYARAMHEEGYRAIWLLESDSYNVTNDPNALYHGLSEDIAFQRIFSSLKQHNGEMLALLREKVPSIFPPQS
ncbi:MAG: adenylate cyclase [Candidatus Azotimanducaceae bacterium]